MFDVYSDWVKNFTGTDAAVNKFSGTSIKDKLSGQSKAYANYHLGKNQFGYNENLMKSLDECDVMTIAVHEVGHFWTLNKKDIWKLLLAFTISMPLILINVFIAFIGFLLIEYAIFKRSVSAEYAAEAYVRKTIGPGMSLNALLALVFYDDHPVMNKHIAKQIKYALEEMHINYEDYIKT